MSFFIETERLSYGYAIKTTPLGISNCWLSTRTPGGYRGIAAVAGGAAGLGDLLQRHRLATRGATSRVSVAGIRPATTADYGTEVWPKVLGDADYSSVDASL